MRSQRWQRRKKRSSQYMSYSLASPIPIGNAGGPVVAAAVDGAAGRRDRHQRGCNDSAGRGGAETGAAAGSAAPGAVTALRGVGIGTATAPAPAPGGARPESASATALVSASAGSVTGRVGAAPGGARPGPGPETGAVAALRGSGIGGGAWPGPVAAWQRFFQPPRS